MEYTQLPNYCPEILGGTIQLADQVLHRIYEATNEPRARCSGRRRCEKGPAGPEVGPRPLPSSRACDEIHTHRDHNTMTRSCKPPGAAWGLLVEYGQQNADSHVRALFQDLE